MPNANNFSPNLERLWDAEGLANNTYRKRLKVGGSTEVRMQWVDQVGDGVATIAVYASLWSDVEREVKELNPALNKHWHFEDSAVFNRLPAAAAGNGVLDLGINPGIYYLMIELTVTTPFTQFELGARGQNHNG